MKKTILLEPSHSSFHFILYEDDTSLDIVISEVKYHTKIFEERMQYDHDVIVVATKSEFSTVPITIQVLEQNAFNSEVDENEWDEIKLIPEFEVKFGNLKLFDPPAGDFYNFDLPAGSYKVKICYGGQNLIEDDGTSNELATV